MTQFSCLCVRLIGSTSGANVNAALNISLSFTHLFVTIRHFASVTYEYIVFLALQPHDQKYGPIIPLSSSCSSGNPEAKS